MSTPETPEAPRPLLGVTELIDAIATAGGVHRPLVRAILTHLEQITVEALREGRRVNLPGIGILEARETSPRTGTSPARPGHPARAWSRPAGRRVALRPARALAAAVTASDADV